MSKEGETLGGGGTYVEAAIEVGSPGALVAYCELNES